MRIINSLWESAVFTQQVRSLVSKGFFHS